MKLFTVGPVEMYPDTLSDSAKPLPYFRTPEFSEVVLECETNLLDLANAPKDSRVIFLTASGSGAMEAAIINCLTNQDTAIVVDGGSFGHRFFQICQRHSISQKVITLDFGKTLTKEMILEAYSPKVTSLIVNAHETSTGQLYDLKMLGNFCKEYGLLFIVDAISSFIADEIDMREMGIDVLIISSQKALALAPGISNVILSPNAISRVEQQTCNLMYFDFIDYLKNGERGQTPFTPAVGIILTMQNRLRTIKAAGIENTRQKIQDLAYYFRKNICGLPIQIPNYPLSNALTPLYFPNKNAQNIYQTLLKEFDITVTPNGGILSDTILRVGHIGNLTVLDIDFLIDAMHKILE